MKKLLIVVISTITILLLTGCNKNDDVKNPQEEACYYVKYRAEASASYGHDFYLVLSCAGGNGQRTTGKEIEIVVGPVSKGFLAHASAYHTVVTSETCAAKVYVTTQIWVSYKNEPFTLRKSCYGLGLIGKAPQVSYIVE